MPENRLVMCCACRSGCAEPGDGDVQSGRVAVTAHPPVRFHRCGSISRTVASAVASGAVAGASRRLGRGGGVVGPVTAIPSSGHAPMDALVWCSMMPSGCLA